MSHLCIFLLVDINGILHISKGRFIDNWLIMMSLDDPGVGFYHVSLKCKILGNALCERVRFGFKLSSKIFLLTIPRRCFFVDRL